ncbi:hypothetical protein QYF61_018405 [Mycteria americana]|uniref:Uncharacterized protein n=1 Tax=Mycteria americana TaxID=33587 RepID=A0AAN7RHP1_MYCAM|nr:hypothetical protein QYF61_018405 [Mycteria americana]
MLPVQIHLSHFNLSSLIHLLVALMFLSGLTLGYLEYRGPRILCIPDSKTLGVDLDSPLVLSARGSRITESQNHIGWKRPLRSSSPTINLTLPKPPLHHVSKHLIQTSFKYLQGWQLNHCPGQPSKPPLAQLEAISSCPITCYLGEDTDPHLSTTSFQVVEESDKVSPQPPFLQARQSQLPQPLLIRLLLQTLHQLRCPSLHTLQHLNIPLVVGGPKLNTVFEGHDHFRIPAGHTISDTSQDAIGFLGHLGTLLAHIQAAVNQYPQVLLCQAAFQPLFPKPIALHGVAVAQVQDPALGLVKPHTIHPSPLIQPVQVPLQSLPTLQQINTPTQLGVVCKLTESTLDPFVQIIDKDVKQSFPCNSRTRASRVEVSIANELAHDGGAFRTNFRHMGLVHWTSSGSMGDRTSFRMPLAFFATRAHCWLMFNLVSTRTPRFFAEKLLPSWASPSKYWCLGLFLPRVPSAPSSRSLMKILNRTGPRTDPWGTLLVTGLQLDFVPLITTL